MAEMKLPSTVNFQDPLKYLPAGIESVLMSVQPNGGSQAFSPSTRVEFSLPTRPGLYIDPKSIQIRGQISSTAAAALDLSIRGVPAYSWISTLTERVNGMNIATVNQYNVTAHRWIKSNLNVADQYGQQSALGYAQTANSGSNDVPSSLDGAILNHATAGEKLIPFSAPLICSAIANCDHMIPTALLGQIQFDFTTEAQSNYTSVSASSTSITIKNLEVCFLAVDMGAETDALVSAMGQKIYLKTDAWATNGQPFSAAAGQQTLNYVFRYASVERVLTGFYGGANCVNGAFDSVDVTAGNGNYQYTCGSRSYPMVPFNTQTCKVGVLQELRRSFGSIADWRHSPSISTTEFNATLAAATTLAQPGSFYVPYCFSRVKSFNPYDEVALMSGVSTANTGIGLIVNCASAPANATTALMAVNYSILIEIDTASRTFTLIQ